VVSVLSSVWGFQHTAEANLDKLEQALDRWADLPGSVRDVVRQRIERIRRSLEESPKTRRWRLRSKVGERIRWYEEVGEVDR